MATVVWRKWTFAKLLAGAVKARRLAPSQAIRMYRRVNFSPQPAHDAASCPGYETSPNLCRCPCYGCKHHCSAHNPDDIETAEHDGSDS